MRTCPTTILGILLVFFVGGFFLYQQRSLLFPASILEEPTQTISKREQEQYTNATYGISFSYPTSYVLTEMDAPGSEMRKHHVITLMRKEDLPLPERGEGPPAITIDIYQNNLDKQTTEGWIRNSRESNFKLGEGRLASTTISGFPALSYRWSGLYEGSTIVLAEPNWIYAFTVTYLEMGAPIVQDFVALREGVQIAQ
jgi:hypothetical protein